MVKTYKKKQGLGTRKNKGTRVSSSLVPFQKQITVVFFEMLLMIKLYHWKTYSYATHKATDSLFSKFNDNVDRFMEVLLGKTGVRIDLTNKKNKRKFNLICRKCNVQKEQKDFRGLNHRCRSCENKENKERENNNKDKVKEMRKKSCDKNKDKINAKRRKQRLLAKNIIKN